MGVIKACFTVLAVSFSFWSMFWYNCHKAFSICIKNSLENSMGIPSIPGDLLFSIWKISSLSSVFVIGFVRFSLCSVVTVYGIFCKTWFCVLLREICYVNFDKIAYILLVFGDLVVEFCWNWLLVVLFVFWVVFVFLVGRNICLVFLVL